MAMLPLEPTYTVAELLETADRALGAALGDDVWVEGEIRSIKSVPVDRGAFANARHVYFDLVEPAEDDGPPVAVLAVKLFDAARRRVNTELKRHGSIRMVDGVRVRIRGRLGIFTRRGQLDLQMAGIDPGYTLAQLVSARDRVLATLEQEGLLDRNAALPLPAVPVRIGLVTSGGSAAHADVVEELEASGLHWEVQLASVRVQGPTAAGAIAAAIERLATSGVDVIAVVRGGGATTDLAAFDAEVVARAIAAAPVPVLTGIGHEVDRSAADVVAHTAHKTPTACAGAIVRLARERHDHAEVLWQEVSDLALRRLHDDRTSLDRLGHGIATGTRLALQHAHGSLTTTGMRAAGATERHLLRCAARVDRAVTALGAAGTHLADRDRRVEETARRTARAAELQLRQAEDAIARVELRREASDPERLLRRGWSVTVDADGRVIRSVRQAPVGSTVRTLVGDGSLLATVTATDLHAGPAPDGSAPTPTPAPKPEQTR